MGQDIIRKTSGLFPDPDAIANHYIPPNMTDDTDFQIRTQVYTAVGDTVLLCPTVYYAEKCAEKKGNVYFYFFTHRPSVSSWAPWIGVTHFDEVQFVFGAPTNKPNYEKAESELSKQMIQIWSSFVKTGSPNIPWPKYDKDRKYKYIGPDHVTGADGSNGVHSEHCDFLKPSFA